MFSDLITCLQEDTSTAVISSALTALIMLLPHMPSSLVPHLPALFNIYARLLFWNRQSEGDDGLDMSSPSIDKASGWQVCAFEPGIDEFSIPHLSHYYTILYGLYPINFMDYIRKPQRYLRHANAANADEVEVQPTEIRQKSERFRECHLLHPNFYTLTIDSEKTDFGRWIKSEAAEVVAECHALRLQSDDIEGDEDHELLINPQAPEAVSELEKGPDAALLSASPATELRPDGGRTGSISSRRSLMRQNSHSSVASYRDVSEVRNYSESGAEGSGLSTSSSHTQLQDMIQSNKAIKSALHRTTTNDSEGSLVLSNKEVSERGITAVPITTVTAHPSAMDPQSHIAVLQRQNLMLQTDLSFERYQRQQHMAHIGELRRKQLAEAATEAETQNLILTNRSLKSRYEEAKKAEIQVRKESERSRAMAKKWEADLSNKMKNLREQSQKTNGELEVVRRELEDAKEEVEKLRKLVCDSEVRELNAKQNLQSIQVHVDEVDRLKAEMKRLSMLETHYQAEEDRREAALATAAAAKGDIEALQMKLAAQENETRRLAVSLRSQISELQAELVQLQEQNRPPPKRHAEVERILAGSRSRQEELQKQYDLLMRKYTTLQSSLLDMESGASPEQIKAESSSSPGQGAEYLLKTHTRLRTRPHRVLSNPEFPEGTAYNVTPPLEMTPGGPSTPGGAGPRPPTPPMMTEAAQASNSPERYHGRGKCISLAFHSNNLIVLMIFL
jgi:hypothetical protein